MSNNFKINKIDFGLASSNFNNPKDPSKRWDLRKLFSLNKIKSSFKSINKYTFKSSKFLITKLNRLKWKVSRSIFLGRGVYFKYISNFSIILMIGFGFFVYSGHTTTQKSQRLSKYTSAAEANYPDLVLTGPGGETFINSRAQRETNYKVQPGDTLSSIAQKFSTQDNIISVDSIRWANSGSVKNDDLQVGSIITIPPVSGTIHIVKKGENVRQIAAKYNIINDKSSEIEVEGALQRIVNTNLLEVDFEGDKAIPRIVEGQKLIVPDGIIIPEPEKVAVVQVPQTKPGVIPKTPQTPAKPIIQNTTVPDGKFIWPVAGGKGLVTDVFRPPVHPATDIADRSSPYVVAVADGTIKYAGWSNGGGGWVIDVEFDNGFAGHYAHTCCDGKRNSYLVKTGDKVVQGQALATMGSTGRSTGTHVHFSLYDIKNRKYVNPANYISR